MLSNDLARHTALKRALGFKFYMQNLYAKSFAVFAEQHGDKFMRADRMIEWASQSGEQRQRCLRLQTIRQFAVALHAEDPRHEIPDANALGYFTRSDYIPRIYTDQEIARIIDTAKQLPPAGSMRTYMYPTLFALLAVTGMRISEALGLQYDDITKDGLLVRQTKFKKSRLIPVHETTERALRDYLKVRTKLGGTGNAVFVINSGKTPNPATVTRQFLLIVRSLGLHEGPDKPRPRLHDLRHTFAVRSLEKCEHTKIAVARHMLALTTYLGHACITDTWWYLRSTPVLMAKIANAVEELHLRGMP